MKKLIAAFAGASMLTGVAFAQNGGIPALSANADVEFEVVNSLICGLLVLDPPVLSGDTFTAAPLVACNDPDGVQYQLQASSGTFASDNATGPDFVVNWTGFPGGEAITGFNPDNNGDTESVTLAASEVLATTVTATTLEVVLSDVPVFSGSFDTRLTISTVAQ